jgi:cysteinyl-tRNA synthetase
MFVLQGQYSNEGNFTFENLAAAKNRLAHWKNIASLRWQIYDTIDYDKKDEITLVAAIGAMKEALNSNLNTPEALRVVDQAFSELDDKSLNNIHQHGLDQLLDAIDDLLGLQLKSSTPDISDEQKQTILERQRARDEKNWQESDRLRDELKKQGIAVRDTSSGTIWEYDA